MDYMIAPLSGHKVVELGTMITAPLAGMMLGDLGAEVIKIERPDGGDLFRSFKDGLYSPHFVAFNRNKRSVVADLQSTEGREILLRLLANCDVLIDNFRPGVLDRLAFSAESLRAHNPRLVHCSITGFGERGPYRDRPAYDTVAQALSGLAGLSVDPAAPKLTGTTISDNVTGMYACYAVLAALVERARTGLGRRIEVNMLEASVAFMPDAFMNFEMLGVCNGPLTRVSFSQSYVVRCRDGQLLALHLSSQEKFWRSLVDVLGKSEIGADPRFARRDGRIKNYEALSETLQAEFAMRDRSDWLGLLAAQDVPCAPVQSAEQVMRDPQLQALGSFRNLDLADRRTVRAIQAPVLFDGQRLSSWESPPLLGQYSSEIDVLVSEQAVTASIESNKTREKFEQGAVPRSTT
jgi:crotonobetainyl-CoA:carnitine CoA-transferase CaiB-like acyl-CoA transferase